MTWTSSTDLCDGPGVEEVPEAEEVLRLKKLYEAEVLSEAEDLHNARALSRLIIDMDVIHWLVRKERFEPQTCEGPEAAALPEAEEPARYQSSE